MNDIARRPASENDPTMRGLAGKTLGLAPSLRNKTNALSDVENRQPQQNFRASAIQRQRANAEKLSKGYSVLTKADKENASRASVRSVVKENSYGVQGRVSLAPVRSSSILSVRSQPSLHPRVDKTTFRVPTKPAKSKNTDGVMQKSASVTSLAVPSITVQEAPASAVSDLISTFGTVIIDDDKKTENDELQLGIYAKDIYRFLKRLEVEQAVRCGYLTRQHIMTDVMRAVLVDWMYEVQQSFDLLQDTTQMAVALLDRFMQDNPKIPKEDLQLVGVTCIFIASKYEEMYPPCISELVQVSAEACSKSQILKMEQRIIRALSFNIGRPPPVQFLRRYGRIAQVSAITYTMTKYIVDLALVQYGFCHLAPSHLAAAALYLAMYLNVDSPPYEDVWTPKMAFFTEYTAEFIQPIVVKLARLVVKASTLKQKCVQEIYANEKKQQAVSLRPELKSDKIRALAELS